MPCPINTWSPSRSGIYVYEPLYILPGGRRRTPRLRKQYRPMATAVCEDEDEEEEDEDVRTRSPRIMTSGWITVLPPRTMFCVPTRTALRATLLPVSCVGLVSVALSGQKYDALGKRWSLPSRYILLLPGDATFWRLRTDVELRAEVDDVESGTKL